MKEYKVGEVFQFGMKKLKCVEVAHPDCVGCVLALTTPCHEFVGECAPHTRQDKKNTIFIEVKEENNG